MKILIVDDEQEVLLSLKRLFHRNSFEEVEIQSSSTSATEQILSNNYDVVLLDMLMPEMDGYEILEKTKPFKPDTEFIMLTAVDDIQSAVKAIRLGAYDYLVKPAEPERIIHTVERAFERKILLNRVHFNKQNDINPVFAEIITSSEKMYEIFNYTEQVTKSTNPILITGESGTGKELIARAIHKLSYTQEAPFITVNVTSVPESLFESHFFGYKKGSFTGAVQDHPGYFVQADKGTLFLDEIGELPLHLQSKLLRVLEDKYVIPVGDTRQINFNCRIVSATNVDLNELCKNNKFRLDLLFRLRFAEIHLPPLNDRGNDIEMLIEYFAKKFSIKYDKNVLISDADLQTLKRKKYPGNIRELSQIIENFVLTSASKIFDELNNSPVSASRTNEVFLKSLKENSREHISTILKYCGNDKNRAAKILGISLRQLQRKIKEMNNQP